MESDRPHIFFDIEATGTNPDEARIIELSVAVVDGNYNPQGAIKSILVNPGFAIPNTDIHCITDAMVREKPPFKAYAKAIFDLFDGAILYGFNIKHYDVPLLSNELARCGITWPAKPIVVIDSYKIYRQNVKRNLAAAYNYYTGLEMEDAHRGEADVKATIAVYRAQAKLYEAMADKTPEQLELYCDEGKRYVDLEGKIILNADNVPIYNTGKYLGQNMPVVNDKGYGQWMISQGTFPNNTKEVLKRLLGL